MPPSKIYYYASHTCPRCSQPMTLKTARVSGNKFLGWQGYPDCKFTVDYDEHVDKLANQIVILQENLLRIKKARRGHLSQVPK